MMDTLDFWTLYALFLVISFFIGIWTLIDSPRDKDNDVSEDREMEITCEICGASTTDEKEIEKVKKNNICPICLSVGSLYINHPTEKGGAKE